MTLRLELPAARDSLFRRFDPRWKLAAVLLCAAAVVALHDLAPLGVALLASFAAVAVSRLPALWYVRRLVILLPLLAGLCIFLPLVLHGGEYSWHVGPVQISARGFCAALRVSAKSITLLNLALVLTATTAPGHLPKAAQSLHLPGFLIHLTAVTRRYASLVMQEFTRLRVALRVRGYRSRAGIHAYRVAGRVLGTLLVRSAERAERVGQAMRSRGFDGHYRTLADFRTTFADVALFAVMSAAAAGLLLWQWRLS